MQRCNNSLKWYDSNGVLHDWACVFQRSLSGTSFIYGSEGVPEVDALLGQGTEHKKEAPAMALDLNDVLSGQIL